MNSVGGRKGIDENRLRSVCRGLILGDSELEVRCRDSKKTSLEDEEKWLEGQEKGVFREFCETDVEAEARGKACW